MAARRCARRWRAWASKSDSKTDIAAVRYQTKGAEPRAQGIRFLPWVPSSQPDAWANAFGKEPVHDPALFQPRSTFAGDRVLHRRRAGGGLAWPGIGADRRFRQ